MHVLLFLLLPVHLFPSNVFLNNYVLQTHKVAQDHRQTRCGLPNMWSSCYQMLDHQAPDLLRMQQLLSSKCSNGRVRQSVPEILLPKGLDRNLLQAHLRCYRNRLKVWVRRSNKEFREGQPNSFGKYNYCRTLAPEFGDQCGY